MHQCKAYWHEVLHIERILKEHNAPTNELNDNVSALLKLIGADTLDLLDALAGAIILIAMEERKNESKVTRSNCSKDIVIY